MSRYHAVARAMRADPFEVLATAAVRDAENGPAFVAGLQARMPGVPIRVLPGKEEARLSAQGVVCGIPDAQGILARYRRRFAGGRCDWYAAHAVRRETMRLGVIRLADRSGGDLLRARTIAEEDTAKVPWLGDGAGETLYLVGGAFRALARIHMAQTGYPLQHGAPLYHRHARRRGTWPAWWPAPAAARWNGCPASPRRRIDDLPFAAVVLRRLLRVTGRAPASCSAPTVCARVGSCERMPDRRPRRRTRCWPRRSDMADRHRPRSDAAARVVRVDPPG